VSPKGAFRGRYREISLALGAKKDAAPAGGGHPFDVVLEVLAPGETCCPYHAHAAQWELFYVLSGEGHGSPRRRQFHMRHTKLFCR
jgi:uncharacterized cupin superfamily protein